MATDLFVPQIWTTKIQRVNHDNLVAKKICNREGEGEIKKAGDTVYFNGLAKPTISTYSGTVSYETLQNAGVTMVIDQQQYFAFKVSDIQKAQANVDLKGSQAAEAAYGIQEATDDYVLGMYAQANRTITDTTLDSATAISVMGKAQQYLAEVNVKTNDMWMVIPPWVKLKLQLAGIKFQINNGINGSGGMAWTNELGFDIFVTNQVTNTGSVGSPVSECLAGSYNSIVYADQIIETESLRLEGSFDTAVRGLHVYGAKVVRPDHLVRMTLTYVDETTI
jgi:hypothetical protein